ncbi:hypothetical protein GCM10010977_03210 [Citricoccus zhacaiensis]|uniref:DUF5642 domain-containing protein n=2 Tax=Citricoccus zhacaiensis TaxID=489142 RepID=A0ABQ2LQU0_9MICC|nr:hypothetical protein GCM10010977_03210 [Citricoccus zhacaiensis]
MRGQDMNRQNTRFRAAMLPSIVGMGLLTLSLAACGGSGDEEESSAPASSAASDEASVSATPSATEDATADASATASSDATGLDQQVEEALMTVLGEGATILTGEQLEQATQESQGLTEDMTVTPEECFDAGQAASGELAEGVENIGGLSMDLSDATMPSTDILMVTTFPSADAAAQSLEATQTQSEDCSEFTVEMGDAMSMEMSLEVQPVEVQADGSFAMTSTTTVALSGATLPPGTESTTATTVVVQDDDRLITYSGTGGGDGVVPVEDGVTLVEDLRAELDG